MNEMTIEKLIKYGLRNSPFVEIAATNNMPASPATPRPTACPRDNGTFAPTRVNMALRTDDKSFFSIFFLAKYPSQFYRLIFLASI
jgi:hypothetical protein